MSKPHILFIMLVCQTISASAYELVTHSRITEQAFLRSNLVVDAQLLPSLGLGTNNSNPFGTKYFDISGSGVQERSANTFEQDQGRMRKPSDASRIQGWLMRGAIREDDFLLGPSPYLTDPDKPFPFIRVFNHFFDPVNRRGLTIGSVAFGDMAPQ